MPEIDPAINTVTDGTPSDRHKLPELEGVKYKHDLDLPIKKLSQHASQSKLRQSVRGTGRNQSTTIHHGRFRGGIGSSILQGAGFINVYSNPVISFDRASSRGVRIRRQKKKLEQSQSLLPDLVYREMNEFDAHKQSYISA